MILSREFWQLFLKPYVLNPRILFLENQEEACVSESQSYGGAVLNLDCCAPLGLAMMARGFFNGINLEKIFDSARTILKPDGVFCVIFDNAYGYTRLLRRKGSAHAYSLTKMTQKLREAGFSHIQCYAFYKEEKKIVDVSQLSAIAKRIQAASLKDAIKFKILRRAIFRKFQPSYVLLAHRVEPRKTFVTALVEGIKNENTFEIIAGNPNTAVIIAQTHVTRVPLDTLSKARCRINCKNLRRMQDTEFSAYVPKVLKKTAFGAYTCYRETKHSGLIIDYPAKKLAFLTREAIEYIIAFHTRTRRDIVIDTACFQRLFSREFSRVTPHLDAVYQQRLATIKEMLQNKLMNTPFKTVWQHGDYKIENIFFAPGSLRLKTVIDWDLARKEGLPLLDVLYLLIYIDNLKTKEWISTIFRERFLKENFNRVEKESINAYMRALGLSTRYVRPLMAMFWITHIASRYGQLLQGESAQKEKFMRENVYRTIDSIWRLYEAKP